MDYPEAQGPVYITENACITPYSMKVVQCIVNCKHFFLLGFLAAHTLQASEGLRGAIGRRDVHNAWIGQKTRPIGGRGARGMRSTHLGQKSQLP